MIFYGMKKGREMTLKLNFSSEKSIFLLKMEFFACSSAEQSLFIYFIIFYLVSDSINSFLSA